MLKIVEVVKILLWSSTKQFNPNEVLPQLSKLSKKTIHAPWLAGDIELDMAGIRLGRDYPLPIVQHDEARKNTLIRYAVVKKESID